MKDSYKGGKSTTLLLPPNTPFGDFATYSDYTWTTKAKRAWREHKTPPLKPADVPKDVRLVTYTFHVPQHRRAADGDVRITKSDFERLEAASKATASIWAVMKEHVALMPKDAIVFTDKQKKAYRDGTIKDESAPCIGECLKKGFRPQDMRMDAQGRPVLPRASAMNVPTAGEVVAS